MSLASVLERLSGRPARSLTESDGVSNCETPRRKRCEGTTLPRCAESAESESMSYTYAGAHTRTRARDVQLAERDSPDSIVSMPPPAPATVLKNCRCRDCRRWDDIDGRCEVCGFVQYIPKEDYDPSVRQFWSDLGMIRSQQWHYCTYYRGPQISKDVWVCPKRPDTRKHDMCG